jgi:hypothetical protein
MSLSTGSLRVVSIPSPSAWGVSAFPAESPIQGAGDQARFVQLLRTAPIVGFADGSADWEPAPRASIPVALAGSRDLDWQLEPDELEQ